MKSLKATTLNTIPALRAIANDVVFDVLMYLTPTFCSEVLECVTEQINELYTKFQQCHPDFVDSGGKASLIGHSLGSVICWDLLTILKDASREKTASLDHKTESSRSFTSLLPPSVLGVPILQQDHEDGQPAVEIGYQHYASEEDANSAQNGSWGPSLSAPMKQCIPFDPAYTIFLGSPIGLFLTLRGAHAVFDELRRVANQQIGRANDRDGEQRPLLLVSPFTLPSGSIHNIFHPSDPVAYRIEPLLLKQGTPETGIPQPMYLTRIGQDVRLHVKAMQVGEDIRRSFMESKNALSSFVTKVTEQASSVLQKLDDRAEGKSTRDLEIPCHPKGPLTFPLGGAGNERIDFQLQPKVIDNEYVSAVTAHSSYFGNLDVVDFIIDLSSSATDENQQNNDDSTNECENGFQAVNATFSIPAQPTT